MLALAASATVSAKGPKPPAPAPSISIQIAATATLEPSRQYANLDLTVTCSTGWTFSSGFTNIRQSTPGGSGTFTASCTGTPQAARSRVVNGNKWTLGNATATAYVNLSRNGQQVQGSATRTISLVPGITVKVASQGQLTGTSGGGARLAVAVACPSGASGASSSVSVTQAGGHGSGSFTPICDGTSRTFVVSIPAQGTFQTGAANAAATANVTWNGGSFSGSDSRGITILESSIGDMTPPSRPANLGANVMGDGETWLSWSASSDNATPSGLIVYEVFLNGRFDQPIGGGFTEAILYADQGALNTIEVIAVDGAGNRSAPAAVQVDCSQGWCF
jgi:hypothetical protein